VEIVRENISKLNDILSITLGVNDYSEKVEKALRNTAKKVDIKGFRKGMVPAGVVKKMYGNSVLAEEVNTILNDAIHNYIEENKLEILGQPLPVEEQKVTLEINTPIDYTFKYEIGLQPSFTLSHIESKPSYDQEEIVIDDKLLNDEGEHMQKRHGSNESPDDIAENDIIYVELVEVNADGSTKEGGVMNSTSFNVDILKAGDDKNKIMGLKKGDSVVLNIFEAFERERESVLKHILNVKEEEAANLGDTFKVTLSNVNRLVNASLDQAFFDKVYGPGIINSEDEMRARITEELKAYFAKQTEVKVLQELAKDLIDKTEMDMPSDFLKRWIKVSNEKEITDDAIKDKKYEVYQ
jgi:trigger factor